MSKPREYQVTGETFYVFARERGLWEAYYRDADGVRQPIYEYCETDNDAVKQCIQWQLRTNKARKETSPEPPF